MLLLLLTCCVLSCPSCCCPWLVADGGRQGTHGMIRASERTACNTIVLIGWNMNHYCTLLIIQAGVCAIQSNCIE